MLTVNDRELAVLLADCLDEHDRNVLGPTDSRLCSKTLRYWARARVRHVTAAVAAAAAAVAMVAVNLAFASFDGNALAAFNYYMTGKATFERLVAIDGDLWRVEYEFDGGVHRVVARQRLTLPTGG